MIDNQSYSDEQKIFMINIGGLDFYQTRKKVIKVLEKLIQPFLPQHHSYTFVDIDHVTVLLIQSETQFIPDLISALCKKRLPIYEVKYLEEQHTRVDWFSTHIANNNTV
ncbi:TPA: hypothetical protein ACUI23_000705 [Staphylococcus pseudintermedius]